MNKKATEKELRILILDDVDAELMELELRKGGLAFSSRCVQTKEDFVKELTKAVISKATFLSLFVIAACPQSFWFFQKDSRLAGMTSM